MLAIKECLIREGVLNLVDSTYNNKNHKISIDFQQSTESIDSNINNYNSNCNNNNNNNNNNKSIQTQKQKQQYQQPLYRHHQHFIVANMDNEASAQSKYQKSVESKNLVSNTEQIQNLNSALATAKASCQQFQTYQQGQLQNQSLEQQRKPEQTQPLEEKSSPTIATTTTATATAKPTRATQRYQGHHPHFHHHTAPAYYTDLHLRIHTPNAADVAALNDNYQSVYSTASKLVEQRHFPKTTTATVAPPPIGKAIANTSAKASSLSPAFNNNQQQQQQQQQQTTRSAFFRGGSAFNNEAQINFAKYAKESPTFVAPADAQPPANHKKGDYIATTDSPHTIESTFLAIQPDNQCDIGLETAGAVNFTCSNFIPTNQYLATTPIATASPATGRRSRSTSHFANRKRAVRVRSESRPISALYDIICKEKGFDIGTTTTNDEDSSASLSSATTTTNSTHSHDGHNKSNNKKKHSKRHSNKKQSSSQLQSAPTTTISKSKSFSSNMSSLSNNSSSRKASRGGKATPSSTPTPTAATTKAKLSSRPSSTTMQDRPEQAQSLPLQSKRRSKKQNAKTTATATATATAMGNSKTTLQSNNEHSTTTTTHDYPADKNSLNLLQNSSQSSNKVAKSSPSTSSNASRLQNHEQQQHHNPQHQYHNHRQCPHQQQHSANLNHHNLEKPNDKSEVFNLQAQTPNHSSTISSSSPQPSPPSLIANVEDLYDMCHYVADAQPKLYLEPCSLPIKKEQSKTTSTSTSTITCQTAVAPIENDAIVASTMSTHSAATERGIRTGLSRQLRDEKRRQTENAIVNIVKPLNDNVATSSANNDNCWHGNHDDDYSKGTSANARRFITRPSQREALRGHRTNSLTNPQQRSDSSRSTTPSPTLNYFSPSPVSSFKPIVPTAADRTSVVAAISPITTTTTNGSYAASNATTTSSTVMTNSAGAPAAILVPANNSYIPAAVNSGSATVNGDAASSSDQATNNAMASADNHRIAAESSQIITNHVGSTNIPITMEAMRRSAICAHKPTLSAMHKPGFLQTCHSKVRLSALTNTLLKKRTREPPQQQRQQQKTNFSGTAIVEKPTTTSVASIKMVPHFVRTTKTTRLRVAAQDKRTDDDEHYHHHHHNQNRGHRLSLPSSPTSSIAKSHGLRESKPSTSSQRSSFSPSLITKQSKSQYHQYCSCEMEQRNSLSPSPIQSRKRSIELHESPKKLKPQFSVSKVEQNLSETQFNTFGFGVVDAAGDGNHNTCDATSQHQEPEQHHELHKNHSKLLSVKKAFRKQRAETVELTMRVAPHNPSKIKSPTSSAATTAVILPNADHRINPDEKHPQLELKHTHRPRTSTMNSESAKMRTSKSSMNGGGSSTKDERTATTGTATPPTTLQSPELSPVEMSAICTSPTTATTTTTMEQRDKSSKRKSNLNRSLNEEATINTDDAALMRRRRRRELGLARPLIPANDAAVRELIVAPAAKQRSAIARAGAAAEPKMHRHDLSFYMESARRGLDMGPTTSSAAAHAAAERKRAQTASPKVSPKQESKIPATACRTSTGSAATIATATNGSRVSRRSDTLPLTGEIRKLRTTDCNRKINEHTKNRLEEILNIVGNATVPTKQENKEQESSIATLTAIAGIGNEAETVCEEVMARASPSPLPTEEMQEQRQQQPQQANSSKNTTSTIVEFKDSVEILRRNRVLKSCSVERDVLPFEQPKMLSPILRRKSSDDPAAGLPVTGIFGASPTAQNQIVSILKKKDHLTGESSSSSNNASPVTFSASVIDTPIKNKRAGILKKRSSLDESRYYSRSHSPDERSILIKTTRRNSFEEIAASCLTPLQQQQHNQHQQQQQQHQPQQQQQAPGILKQSSYDSNKSDGCPSATEMHPHSILKKKDSSSTPSDLAIGIGGASGGSAGVGVSGHKHVSISQAVTLAAAELVRESNADYGNADDCFTPSNEEYEIRPILKQESTSSEDIVRPPKPILKKKSSGDSDDHGIRPILKTSRKSSREEFYDSGDEMTGVRPILKTESPSKRRSLGGIVDGYLLSPPSSPIATSSSSLLKRRTRSLERHDGSQIVDLGAALDAIATSQSAVVVPTHSAAIATTTSTTATAIAPTEMTAMAPIETAPNPTLQRAPSVAERIRNMEMFLNRQSNSQPLANSTFATPANNNGLDAAEGAAAGSSNITKPSILRRDLYRERYKTQPVTSDEKNFYKEKSTPFEASGSVTSVFRPTTSQNTTGGYISFAQLQQQQQRQQQQQHQQLLQQSSANIVTLKQCFNQNNIAVGNNTPFEITRSNTQPISCYKQQRVHSTSSSSDITSLPPPASSQPSLSTYSKLQQQQQEQQQQLGNIHLHNDSTNTNSNISNISNITILNDQSTLPISSDSERIFEMSGIEQQQQQPHSFDSPMLSISENDGDGSDNGLETTISTASGATVGRNNSVRARANMFQQLQQQRSAAGTATNTARDNEQKRRISPKRFTRRASPPPAHFNNSKMHAEPRTPDEEIEITAAAAATGQSLLLPTQHQPAEAFKGILKSKSGCIGGLMPIDLNAELKNRLKKSTHATVANLRKSATTNEMPAQQQSAAAASALEETTTIAHDDAVNLVRNLSNLGRAAANAGAVGGGDGCASASEGESSGGREISAIIKNSAVARRRKLNDGNLIAKSKSYTAIPPPGGVAIGIGPQLPPIGNGGFVKLRHVDIAKTNQHQQEQEQEQQSQSQSQSQPNAQVILSTAAASTVASAQPAISIGNKTKETETQHNFKLPDDLKRSSSTTQIMGPDQRIITITKTGSIADRLAALQKSGEDDWKKRISKRDEVDEICRNFVNDSISLSQSLSDKPLLQSPLITTTIEGGKVAERLGKLKTSSESWKNRVEQSDATKFTVAGRLQTKANATEAAELQFERLPNAAPKKCPLHVVRSANQPLLGLAKSPSMMVGSATATVNGTAATATTNGKTNGHKHAMLQRSISVNAECGNGDTVNGNSSNSDDASDDADVNEQEQQMTNNQSTKAETTAAAAAGKVDGARVIVPRIDDEETFENFFASSKPMTPAAIVENVEIGDFDHIKATERLATKRTIQGPKRRHATSNPLKALAARQDITSEYTETKSGIAERELRRIKLESYGVGKRNNLAAEAIAGLASVEDFKSVSLKSSSLPLNQMWLPYKPLMLLHVKGRTHIQTRLVEPSYASLNRGDCFILVAGNQLFRYIGSYANVIEISRSKKLCANILENKDLGCTANTEVILTDGKFQSERQWEQFCELLGKPEEYKIPDSGHADEDDIFESSLIETNKIYEFQNDALLPMVKYWGCLPKVDMLDTQKVLIFDFGSEMYIWNGKNARVDAKRAALKLAQEHFDTAELDYSSCYLNPLNYAAIAGKRDSWNFEKRIAKRTEWSLLGKITQNMETSLFKEKFADWPEVEREDLEKDYLANGVNSVKALDGLALYKGEPYEEPNLVLENANLGRGNFYYDTDTMRHFEVITKSTDKWLINEFNFDTAEATSYGHFYSAESYIVRWIYQISVTVRELSGKVSNRSTVGRDRCVYFCWQGNDSTTNEKGSAALLTVELDKEKGAQMRVAQGDESTAFVRLFKPLIQHKGRKDECLAKRSQWRLYQILGNVTEETLLKEVDCHVQQLRSRASMLLWHGAKGCIYVWHGCQSAQHTRQIAEQAAKLLCEQKSNDLFTADTLINESVEEGQECAAFREALPSFDANAYGSLMKSADKQYNYTPRLYYFSSTQGVFQASELLFAFRSQDLHSPYPFTQTQLYGARQPSIFMIDDNDTLWMWMGWWPVEDIPINTEECSSPTNDNRAGVNRWISERRAALETAVSYWRAKFGDNEAEQYHGIRGYVVWAGLETLAFKALFPDWSDRDDVKEINMQDGRTDTAAPIAEVLAQLTQTEYPLDVLKQRPLPEGVEPTRLELYLNVNDFQQALGMTKTEFEQLPVWKQTNLKKERGLF